MITKFVFEAIGTLWQIDLDLNHGLKKEEILSKVTARIDEFDKNYSRFRTDSLISKISQSKGSYKMPEDFKRIFDIYKTLNKASNGLFTPLIGNVLEDLGYDKTYSLKAKTTQIPFEFQDVLILENNILTTTCPVMLDFGAGGKGYLIDLVGELLNSLGIHEYCIDAGGDIFKKGNPLKVGLENPNDTTQVIGSIELYNNSICGSAGNRRTWGTFHHIINPHTLKSPTDILAVWVRADSAIIADAMSTALFLTQEAQLKSSYICDYLILYKDLTFDKSTGFDAELFMQ